MRVPKSQIYYLREKKNLTQDFLSKCLGVSLTGYRRWEKKTSVAHNIVKLILLCRLLSCGPQGLRSNEDSVISKSTSEQNYNPEQIRQSLHQKGHSNSENCCPKTKLSELLTKLRSSRRITQEQIRYALDVSESTIQNWENGRSCPSLLNKCIILCDIFECRIEELVDYIPEEQEIAVQNLLQIPIIETDDIRRNLSQIKSDFRNSISGSSILGSETSLPRETEAIE